MRKIYFLQLFDLKNNLFLFEPSALPILDYLKYFSKFLNVFYLLVMAFFVDGGICEAIEGIHRLNRF